MFVKSMRATLLAASLASASALALSPAVAQTTPAPAQTEGEDPVVARVNGKEIKRSAVLEALQGLGPQAQQVPLQAIYPQLLENMIAGELLEAQGYKQKLQDTAEVKEAVKAAEEEYVQQAYLRRAVDAKLTDELVRQRYDKWAKETVPEEEVRARHILVETKEEADAIIKKLNGGAKFEELAAEQKIDTASAQNQGDLGYFTKDMMVEPFANAAFAMKPGEVTKEPVETQFGWHVIKVEDKRKQELPSFEQVQPRFRQAVAQEIAQEVITELRKGAKIETFNIDGTPIPTTTGADTGAAGGEAAKPKK